MRRLFLYCLTSLSLALNFPFLAGTQLARKWQRGWQPSSQRKMRYFTQESDNCMIFLSSEVHLALLIKLARSLRSVAKAWPGVSASTTSKSKKISVTKRFAMSRDRLRTKQDNAAEAKVAEAKVWYESYHSYAKIFQLEIIEEPEPPLSPLLPPTNPGGFVFKTEAELEEQILREIDLNRKKVREKRAEKKRKQEMEGVENLSPER